MKKLLFYLILAGCSAIFVNSVDPEENFIVSLVNRYEQYNMKYRQEHVFVQLDKELYKPGESIWFKGYVSSELNADAPALSNDFLIILLDNLGQQILWERYPVEKNTASGCMVIPKSTEGGKYTFIAFTSWMKNMDVEEVYSKDIIISEHADKEVLIDLKFPEGIYMQDNSIKAEIEVYTKNLRPAAGATYSYTVNAFDEVIAKGKDITNDGGKSDINFNLSGDMTNKLVTLNVSVKYQGSNESIVRLVPGVNNEIDIKFYPEGGSLIKNIESKVAFKAVDSYGLPYDFQGGIYDENNELISDIKTSYNGRGIFNIVPGLKQYKVKITKPDNVDKEFHLPEVKSDGISLTYKGLIENSIVLQATSGNTSEIEQTYWIAENGNKICWGANIKIQDVREVKIPVINFTTGILRITIFNESKSVAAERFIYVNKMDAKPIKAKTDKLKYSSREKVTLEIFAGQTEEDSSALNLSVSVVNKNLFFSNNNSGSFRCGKQPDIELSQGAADFIGTSCFNSSPENNDLLMMSSDYKGISYTEIFNSNTFDKYPYYIQDGISGFVLDKKGNPVSNAKIKLIHAPDMEFFETESNGDGIFNVLFKNDVIDFNFLSLSVSEESSRLKPQVLADNEFYNKLFEHFQVNEEDWNIQKTMDLIAYNDPKLIYTGKYKKTRQNQLVLQNDKKYDADRYSSYTNVLDIIHEIKPFNLINNQIVFPGGTNSLLFQSGALIVIDGIKAGTDVSVLKTISPNDIDNINVSTNVVDIHAYTGLNAQGVIEITTIGGKNSRAPQKEMPKEVVKENYYTGCEFYTPDYASGNYDKVDIRTTLYWNPMVTVNTGEETVLDFYNSDIKGEYIGVISGMTRAGVPVFAEFNFIVE